MPWVQWRTSTSEPDTSPVPIGPFWVAAGEVPKKMWEGKDAPITREAFLLKDMLRPLVSRERREFVDLTCLDDAGGTGWLPATLAVEREIMKGAEELLAREASPSELCEFSKLAAAKALAALQKIKGKAPATK